MLAAHRGHEESRGAVGEMEHRSGVEVDDIRAEPEFGRAKHRVGDDVAMTEHHPFRTSRRSPGVEHAGEIIARCPRRGSKRPRRSDLRRRDPSPPVADADDVPQLRAGFAQHRQERVVDEQRGTAGYPGARTQPRGARVSC